MNSTAIRNRTEASRLAFPVDTQTIRGALAFVLLAVLWVSFTPFTGDVDLSSIEETGNPVNQLGYTGMCAVALAALATLVDRRITLQMFGLGWIALYAVVLLSATHAFDPDKAVRSVAFSLIAATMAASVIVLAPTAETLSRVLLAASALVLVLCYSGIVLIPDKAIHQAVGVEAIHGGLWRGLFTHKNIAGPIMASIAFIGLYLSRRGLRWQGILITVAALFFVWKTGSKTSAALIPAIILMVALPASAGIRVGAALLVFAAIASIHALTIGTVYVPLFDAILRGFNPDTTYTGRVEIWEFARDYVATHPLTGFGYDSFWQTAATANGEQPFDRAWDPRGIVHGHNGFLDITLFMGFPALLLAIWLFVLAPIGDYLRTPAWRENVLLADLCLMIVAFVTMNAALESFFFRRDDPVWLTLVVALFGLRMTARTRIRTTSAPLHAR